jgi:hypothetical protein
VYYIIPHSLNITQQDKMQVLGLEENLVGFKEWYALFNKELAHSDILLSADSSQLKNILIGCRQYVEMHVCANQFRKIDSQSRIYHSHLHTVGNIVFPWVYCYNWICTSAFQGPFVYTFPIIACWQQISDIPWFMTSHKSHRQSNILVFGHLQETIVSLKVLLLLVVW